MAKMYKLTKGGQTIYPATITDAVVNPKTRKSLATEISDLENEFSLCTFENEGFVNKSGLVTSAENWYNSGMIDLSVTDKITARVPYMNLVSTLAFFDTNEIYIGEIDPRTIGTQYLDTESYYIELTKDNYLKGSKYINISISTAWAGGAYANIYTKAYSLPYKVDVLNKLVNKNRLNGIELYQSDRDYELITYSVIPNRRIIINGTEEVNHTSLASIDVVEGEKYKLNTYTFGVSYQYAFYNNEDFIDSKEIGSSGNYVEHNVEITIPVGVNRLYVSLVNNNSYNQKIYKSKIINEYNSSELGYYEETEYTPILGKLARKGALTNIEDNPNYGYVLIDVKEGDIYNIQTGTTIGDEYAYCYYNNDICIEKFRHGSPSTSIAVNDIIKIPIGVNKLLVDFSLVYFQLNRFSIKKKIEKKIDMQFEQIFPKLKSGNVNLAGSLVDNSDFSYAEIEGGGIFRYSGGVYGGQMHAVGYFIDEKFYGLSLGNAGAYRSVDEVFSIPQNATKTIFNFSNFYITNKGVAKIEKAVKVSSNTKLLNCKGKKQASLGDSITADDYCKIGTLVSGLLGTQLIGNFAVGSATCSDAINGSQIDLVHSNKNDDDFGNSDDNVLSNQVRRLLAHTTALGEQITWKHPIDGDFSIETTYGTGKGNTADIPDIIYIAITINDGGIRTGEVVDDTEEVFEQTYSQLTRKSIASALRWAIETLQSAYPNAAIFVATPLWTASNYAYASRNTVLLKREIVMKTAAFCSVRVIDSTFESGFTKMVAASGSDSAGIHPDLEWRYNIAKYVANSINNEYTAKGTSIFYGLIN